MNKYILLLGVAAVSISSYAAYAANSATMNVTATIAHDVSLGNVTDLNIGTITINPADTGTDGYIKYNLDGTVSSFIEPITAATAATPGTFTANIANPSACTGASNHCGGLSVPERLFDILGGTANYNDCIFAIVHDVSNKFKVVPTLCEFRWSSDTVAGTHTKTITISYTAS
ncbi:MAG: hypothetical protein IJ689_07505 [Alphaproteobacteria bacterium]|nr:hypothetical protein [Alphaproteobacteria bacterium]